MYGQGEMWLEKHDCLDVNGTEYYDGEEDWSNWDDEEDWTNWDDEEDWSNWDDEEYYEYDNMPEFNSTEEL